MLIAWLAGFVVNLLVFTAVWGWSVRRRDVSVVDAWWSLAFLMAAGVAATFGGPLDSRKVVLLVAIGLWGLRLSLYLARRNHNQPEDRRYAAMRAAQGEGFSARSLVTVFWLQATLAALIGLPHLLVLAQPSAGQLGWIDAVALLLFVVGFGFESAADAQLAAFKAHPESRGQVLDRGVWRYSRHPNYFGEACLWWGFGVAALAVPHGWLAVPSVVLMTYLLLRVSGVTLLEKDIGERRPAYRGYIARTSAFLPWPPRRSGTSP